MLNGVVVFVKQLDGPLARWLGYIYCPVLERAFSVNEQRMLKGTKQPVLGAAVEFEEGVIQKGKDFAAATSVRECASFYDPTEPLVTLDITAAIYRLSPQIIRARLERKLLVLHEESGKTLLSIAQIKVLADWSVNSASVKQTKAEPLDPPDDHLRFGQLVKHEFDRGFGFVKEQGKDKSEVFAHIKNLKFEPELNDWLVFAVGADGRVSWARKPAQALPWLRRSYAAFSVDALDELFRMGNQQLADEVLAFRIERVLAAKTETRFANGVGLLQKIQKLYPRKSGHAYERLISSLEGVSKLRLWGQFGDATDALSFTATLDEAYQNTLNQQAAEMPRVLMLGMLDIGREQLKAEAIVQAWWPARKIEYMTEAQQIEASSSLFKWLREWYRLLSLGNLLPSAHEIYVQRWQMLANVLRAHFAQVGGALLGAKVYEATGLMLPVLDLVRERADLLSEDALLDLVRDGGETGYLALTVALRRLGRIDTEAKYEHLRKWLSEMKQLQIDNFEWKKEVMVMMAEFSSPVHSLNLWSANLLPDLEWQKIVGQLDEESARKVALDADNKDNLRLSATHRLLHLYLQASSVPDAVIVSFLKELYGARRSNSSVDLKSAEEFRQSIGALSQEMVKERPDLAFAMWQAELLTELPGSIALARLVTLAAADNWATLPAWTWLPRPGVRPLTKLLELLLGADNSRLLELPRSMLLPWLEQVADDTTTPDSAHNKILLNEMLTSERQDIVLPLLVWGIHQTSAPAPHLLGLNTFELEALLEAPNSQVRLVAAFSLLDAANATLDQGTVIRILARMGLVRQEENEAVTVPDGYYQSATLGRLRRRNSIWYLDPYKGLLQAPAGDNGQPQDNWEQVWDSYPSSKAQRMGEKEQLDESQIAALAKYALGSGNTRLQHLLWKARVVEAPAYDQIYDEINYYANGFGQSGDEAAWESAYELIKPLNESQRLAFLDWILIWGYTNEMAGWSSKFLHSWLIMLPDTAEKQATWTRLLNALTTPSLLKLWLADLLEHYDFDAYRLLVFTLSPVDQILFLRKTFKLLAVGKLQLNASQLNTIVRFSQDELGGGRTLDYSLDLALVVLLSLSQGGPLPGEGGIIEVVCRYLKEDTTALTLIGKELFASCLGRSEMEKIKSSDKDIVNARVSGIEYPASADKKTVFIEGVPTEVTNNSIELSESLWPVSWIVTPGYEYHAGPNNPKLKPDGIELCEGRLAYRKSGDLELSFDSQLPFWWCCNRPCFKPNQGERAADDWQRFSLIDFINILGLEYDVDSYYTFVGLINRVNRLLARLQCRCCGHVLRPAEQSDFNFYRVTRFKCANQTCAKQGQEIYLSHCLNGQCMTVIDSRDSNRCSYRTEGRPDRHGMYICSRCGGCCSKQALIRRKENLEKTYLPHMLTTHGQYKLIAENLDKRLYHWERMRVFCHKCTKPMQQRHPQANYTCPDCHVEYRLDMVHVEVARKKKLVEEES